MAVVARPLPSVRAAEGAVVGLPAAPLLALLASRPPAVLLLGLSHTNTTNLSAFGAHIYILSESNLSYS